MAENHTIVMGVYELRRLLKQVKALGPRERDAVVIIEMEHSANKDARNLHRTGTLRVIVNSGTYLVGEYDDDAHEAKLLYG